MGAGPRHSNVEPFLPVRIGGDREGRNGSMSRLRRHFSGRQCESAVDQQDLFHARNITSVPEPPKNGHGSSHGRFYIMNVAEAARMRSGVRDHEYSFSLEEAEAWLTAHSK
jgi:hypothetical protein